MGCARTVVDDGTWLEPVEWSEETVEWFKQQDLPDYVKTDLWEVSQLNRKIREILKGVSK